MSLLWILRIIFKILKINPNVSCFECSAKIQYVLQKDMKHVISGTFSSDAFRIFFFTCRNSLCSKSHSIRFLSTRQMKRSLENRLVTAKSFVAFAVTALSKDCIFVFSTIYPGNLTRAKTIKERFHSVKNNSNFENGALFPSLSRWWRRAAISKLELFFDWMESFLYCLSCRITLFSCTQFKG